MLKNRELHDNKKSFGIFYEVSGGTEEGLQLICKAATLPDVIPKKIELVEGHNRIGFPVDTKKEVLAKNLTDIVFLHAEYRGKEVSFGYKKGDWYFLYCSG